MKIRLVLGAALFTAVLPAAELHVAVSATPVTVDGKMSEYVYVGYDWSQPFIVFDSESTVTNGLFEPVGKPFCDLGTQGGVFTDATNLYVAVLAPCDKQHPAGAADGVGVAVSPDGKTVFVVECGTDGKCVVSRIGADGARTPLAASGVRGGVNVGKRSFNAEISIPYATLGQTPDGGGAVWKCNIYRTGPSCGGISSWSPVQGDMFNTDRFGDIVFGKSRVVGVPLPENVGKTTFLWAGDRWSGGPEVKPPLDVKELEKISLSGPRGGRAVAHFRVSNRTERPALYSFTMMDYAKNELARRIRFREVGNVELKGGPTVPDPIFDLPNGSVLRISPKSTAMVWVDVDTEGLKSGLHRAALTLVPGYSKFEEKTLALELTVGKADIREIDMPCWTYPLRHADDLRALRDYRFNVSCVLHPWLAPKPGPDGRRDWTQLDKVITALLENCIRTNEVRILCYDLFPRWSNPRDNPEKERTYIENMRAGIAYVKKRWGIGLDRIWFSTVDEPHGDPDDPKSSASFAFYGAQLAKRIDPALKSWTNPWKGEPQYLPRYLKAFDVLEPSLGHLTDFDPDAPRKYAESGREIWSYAIYLKQNRPMQYRGISWRNFAYGFSGPSTFYDLFDMAGDGFNSYDRNGAADYGAVYKDRRTGRMSPSLRLEAWYQGHIEQRLLKWCKTHIDALHDRTQASAFATRLDALVKRAVAPRPAFDTISRELLMLSDELAGRTMGETRLSLGVAMAVPGTETRETVRREAFIHQGYGNALPRNSMEALTRAWEQGGIPETDARYTKDGVIISFHDGSWKGRRIADCTWAELRDEPVAAAHGAQFANIRIPTLEAIFSAMKGHPERRIFLDDKDVGPKALAALARKYGVGAQVIFHTNKSTIVREWKSYCPDGKSNIVIGGDVMARVTALAAEDFAGVDRILIIVRTDFSKPDPFVKPTSDELKKAISVAHRHGVLVNVFFFGDAGANPDAYVRALALGADSIGTERPDAFFAWLAK